MSTERKLLPAADPEVVAEREEAKLLQEIREFKKDPWWAIEHGYVITEDEHAKPGEATSKPMPQYEFLQVLTRIVHRSNIGLVLKSRQMMLSWLFCWILLHDAIAKDGRLEIAQGKREEDISAKGTKGIMGRIKFMREHLPVHLRPILRESAKMTEVYTNNSTILAIPQGPDVIRSLTASRVFMDELAFHPEGEKAWTAALPTIRGGGSLWGVTTPNGREFCYRQADPRMPWDNWEKWPAVMPGFHGYKNANGVQLIALHYTADDQRRSAEHQDEIRKGYTSVALYRQENELDFTVRSGDPVFPEFNADTHVMKVPYVVDPRLPIYRGWDFGFNGMAVGFFQFNLKGQMVWWGQILYKRVALQRVCLEVQRRTLTRLGRAAALGKEGLMGEVELCDLEGRPIEGARLAKIAAPTSLEQAFDYGDPSSQTHNTKGETDQKTLKTFGFTLRSKPTTGRKRALIEQFRSLLLPRSDGTPGLLISPGPDSEMKLVIEGFRGGYHYPEAKEGRADKEIPHKDGTFDHIFDQAQYVVDHVRPSRAAVTEDLVADGDGSWKDSAWVDSPWADYPFQGP